MSLIESRFFDRRIKRMIGGWKMIKKIVPLLATALMFATTAHSDTWKMDKPHSSVGFTVTHLMIAKVHGKFNDFDGTVEFDGEDVENGSVNVTIETASVDTDIERRDNHLRSEDFFHAEEYPVMAFKSKEISKQGDNKYKIIGDLTIKDATKEVALDAEYHGFIKDLSGSTRAAFSATGKINRGDFGLTWNRALESGGVLVSDEVFINIETELVKPE
jgi:polyisoprenoid-binding protein YceI